MVNIKGFQFEKIMKEEIHQYLDNCGKNHALKYVSCCNAILLYNSKSEPYFKHFNEDAKECKAESEKKLYPIEMREDGNMALFKDTI